MILPPPGGAFMKRDLNIVYAERDVDVLVGRVMGCLDGRDSIICKNHIQHIVYHVIGQVLIYQHDIVNKYALHILFVVVCIGGNGARRKERILLDRKPSRWEGRR